MVIVPASSKEFLHIPVADGSAGIPGEIAVIASCNEPAESDWKTATWDSGNYKVLIGPATSLPLTVGTYTAWVRLTAAPEVIVRRSGPVRVGA
ncbi:hypothetical protein [Nonomuraea basaltis]|uniref:hypothetical protein n=1 Tax=Nonomuraea basaltis TaxID=2495887 RepID=UPI00110C5024|nr:hypothetical protein [Nonomuraea basaltis]TMS00167.1 hypothetical protein EJK15_03590 [Nonomuraea basaltis]